MATRSRTRIDGQAVSSLKTRKVIERLGQKIQEGSFYEAHQTYRALYQRLCSQGCQEQAVDLLLEGASTLLKHEQVIYYVYMPSHCSYPISSLFIGDMILDVYYVYNYKYIPGS